MKSQFGKCVNEVIKCWSQTIYSEISLLNKHNFGLFDTEKNLSSQFLDLDIENALGGTLAKFEIISQQDYMGKSQ
jgi:hypothetical protein